MCIINNIIKKYAKFHSHMIYNEDKKSFNMKRLSNKNSGVYFILEICDNSKVHIHKVGMADGKNGLQGRLSTYWQDNNSRLKNDKDKTMKFFYNTMTNELKDRVLTMYYMEVPVTAISMFGYDEITSSPVRDLEYKLSVDAEKEGHPLTLSKFH